MKTALIIFVRNPVLGKVKTRLAATMGNEKALAVYLSLLNHTKKITENLPVTKYVFYADEINENDLWNGFEKKLQTGTGLGQRLKNAFEELFILGHKQVCIIGSDCYQLTTCIVKEAFEKLQSNDVVIGPATDGGYYLLGMCSPLKDLFRGIAWSRENVMADTLKLALGLKLLVQHLPVLNDVDEEKDIDFDYS